MAAAPSVTKPVDFTGRDRAAWNVISSWAGHLVFVISGFIMPRMIDHYVGQTSLGIWDFSWSLVNYFGLAGLGIGSSVNRYVAMHRSRSDTEELSTAVSSVMIMQCILAVAIASLTAALVFVLPRIFSTRIAGHMQEARWVIGLLGGSLTVQMAFDFYRGVITGCHRWDLHNAINATAYAGTVAGMIAVLRSGGGLRAIGSVYLGFTIATEIWRAFAARRVCPELRLSPRLGTFEQAKKMLAFGTKRIIAGLPPLILNQSCSVLIASYLGPATLAVYSRPAGLMRSAQTFIDKFAFVTVPTAAALQQSGDDEQLRSFLVRSTQFAVAITAPLVMMFSIQGPSILSLWMGSHYSRGAAVLLAMSLGLFLPMTQQPAMNILIGMNKHGKLGLFTVTTALLALFVGLTIAHFMSLSLTGAALMATLPLALANGVVLPMYACRQLKQPFLRFFITAYLLPLAMSLPFAVVLVLARTYYGDRPLTSLLISVLIGGLSLAPAAWRWIPGRVKQRLSARLAMA